MRGVDTPMHTMDIEFGVAENKDKFDILMTAKSRGCFMRNLKFTGHMIQAI